MTIQNQTQQTPDEKIENSNREDSRKNNGEDNKKESLLPFEKIKREVLVRKESETDPKFGCAPEQRSMEQMINLGVINVDKPSGPTSHQVSSYVQKILGVDKGGHSGTLDPKVTGVLPVAIGRATKVVQFLLNAGKEYICIMHIHHDVPKEKIIEVIKSFVGKIKQLPPIKSAVKRQWRYRKVYYIDIIEIDGKDVLFRVGCQAGTYIRKLCSDIGQVLGCGAHMAELRRTKAGPFSEKGLVNLIDLHDAAHFYKNEGKPDWLKRMIVPLEYAVSHLPKVWIFDTTVDTLCHGADLHVPGISKIDSEIQEEDDIAVMTLKGELVMAGKARMTSMEMKTKEKGMAVKTIRVFMEPSTYPKIKKK